MATDCLTMLLLSEVAFHSPIIKCANELTCCLLRDVLTLRVMCIGGSLWNHCVMLGAGFGSLSCDDCLTSNVYIKRVLFLKKQSDSCLNLTTEPCIVLGGKLLIWASCMADWSGR